MPLNYLRSWEWLRTRRRYTVFQFEGHTSSASFVLGRISLLCTPLRFPVLSCHYPFEPTIMVTTFRLFLLVIASTLSEAIPKTAPILVSHSSISHSKAPSACAVKKVLEEVWVPASRVEEASQNQPFSRTSWSWSSGTVSLSASNVEASALEYFKLWTSSKALPSYHSELLFIHNNEATSSSSRSPPTASHSQTRSYSSATSQESSTFTSFVAPVHGILGIRQSQSRRNQSR
jgi:hypothetical protein